VELASMKLFLRTLALLGVPIGLLAACAPSGADSSPALSAGVGNVSGPGPNSGTGGAGQTGSVSNGGVQSTGGGGHAGNLGTRATGADPAGSSGGEASGATAGKSAGGSSGAGRSGAGGIDAAGVAGHATGGGAGPGGSTTFDPCPASGDCKVLPLGDSITYGSTTNNGGYRVQLFTRAHADTKHLTFVGSQLDGPNTVAGITFPRNNEGHPGYAPRFSIHRPRERQHPPERQHRLPMDGRQVVRGDYELSAIGITVP
jgi:hypothetical protein